MANTRFELRSPNILIFSEHKLIDYITWGLDCGFYLLNLSFRPYCERESDIHDALLS